MPNGSGEHADAGNHDRAADGFAGKGDHGSRLVRFAPQLWQTSATGTTVGAGALIGFSWYPGPALGSTRAFSPSSVLNLFLVRRPLSEHRVAGGAEPGRQPRARRSEEAVAIAVPNISARRRCSKLKDLQSYARLFAVADTVPSGLAADREVSTESACRGLSRDR